MLAARLGDEADVASATVSSMIKKEPKKPLHTNMLTIDAECLMKFSSMRP